MKIDRSKIEKYLPQNPLIRTPLFLGAISALGYYITKPWHCIIFSKPDDCGDKLDERI